MDIKFTASLDEASATNVENYSMEQWNYKWTPDYGSPEFSVTDPSQKKHDQVVPKSVKLLSYSDKNRIFLELPDLKPVHQYKVKVKIAAADGSPISQDIYGTIHKVQEGRVVFAPNQPPK